METEKKVLYKEEILWESPVEGKGVGGIVSAGDGIAKIKLTYYEAIMGKIREITLFESKVPYNFLEIYHSGKKVASFSRTKASFTLYWISKISLVDNNTLRIYCSDTVISKEEMKQAGMI
jgi:hypothetical protein